MAASPSLKLHIPHDLNSPGGLQSARRYDLEGGGFTLIFTLPYNVADVYKELVAEKQLGVDHQNITIELFHKKDAAALGKQLALSATASEAADMTNWLAGAGAKELYVGVRRKVTFPDGPVISELIDLQTHKKIQWRQLTSERETNMLGKPDDSGAVAVEDLPKVTLDLEELPSGGGTTYDFYKIINKTTGHELKGDDMAKLLGQATQGWSIDMKRRGYEPLATTGEELSSTPRSSVVRAAKFMASDQEEEMRMKGLMKG